MYLEKGLKAIEAELNLSYIVSKVYVEHTNMQVDKNSSSVNKESFLMKIPDLKIAIVTVMFHKGSNTIYFHYYISISIHFS